MIRTLVINLDSDADRLEWMRGQLEPHGIGWERFAALRGDALPETLKRYFVFGPDGTCPHLSRGEVGCYASHLAIMEMMVREDIPALLVLEDDLAVGAVMPAVLAAVERFPADWDIVRLSGLVKTAVAPVLAVDSSVDLVKYSRVPLGTGAYLISRKGAETFLAWARKRPLSHPIDQDLRRVWDCRLRTYGVAPAPIEQDVLQRSSIDTIAKRAHNRGVQGKLKLRGWGYFFEPLTRARYNMDHLGPEAWFRTAAANSFARVSKRFRRKLAAAANG